MRIKNVVRGRMSEYTKFSSTAKYFEGKKPIEVYNGHVDAVVPSAT